MKLPSVSEPTTTKCSAIVATSWGYETGTGFSCSIRTYSSHLKPSTTCCFTSRTITLAWPPPICSKIGISTFWKTLSGAFPTYGIFFGSLVFKSTRTTIKRQDINAHCHVDWASGAFLVFEAELYAELGGFDERYYLYCEDVDICWRARHLDRKSVVSGRSVDTVW